MANLHTKLSGHMHMMVTHHPPVFLENLPTDDQGIVHFSTSAVLEQFEPVPNIMFPNCTYYTTSFSYSYVPTHDHTDGERSIDPFLASGSLDKIRPGHHARQAGLVDVVHRA